MNTATQKFVVITISMDQAKDALANWYTDCLINDRQNTFECLRKTGITSFVPNCVNHLTSKQVRDMVGEFNLAEQFVKSMDVDQVFIKYDEYQYECVWDKRNMSQEDFLEFKRKIETIPPF